LIYIRAMKNVVLTLLFYLFAGPALALELALPVACTIGTDCWVQQYFDHDKTSGSKDYTCGVASYDGHDGTDIRVLYTSEKVSVIASASGTVKAVRDGVADNLVKTEQDVAAVRNIECGNGIVVTHDDGWETQYCHMRKGSVAVQPGQTVNIGQKLGEIGFSGNAAFPHVHLTVRKNGKAVDPFSADSAAECSANDRSLWHSQAQKDLSYKGAELLQMQWAGRVYSEDEIASGPLPLVEFKSSDAAIVLFAQAINLHKDDVATLNVSIPGEKPILNTVVIKRNRALQKIHAGKKMRGNWPKGNYSGRINIVRAGAVVLERELRFTMP
jgi:murein DD-endopeptidase MepM/ murein hydrolase activator NlpD